MKKQITFDHVDFSFVIDVISPVPILGTVLIGYGDEGRKLEISFLVILFTEQHYLMHINMDNTTFIYIYTYT